MTFEDEVRAALDRALGAVHGQIDAELRGLADGVAAATAGERARAAARAAEMAEAAGAEVRRELESQIRAVESQLLTVETQREELVTRLSATERELRDIRSVLEQAEEQHRHLESQRDEAHAQRDEAHAQRDEAHAQRDEARAQRDEAQAQRDEAQAQRAEAEAAREQTEAIRRDAELQLRQLEQQHQRLDAEAAELRAAAQQQVEEVRTALDAQIAELKRSLADVRRGAQGDLDRAVEDAMSRARAGALQDHLAHDARLVDAVRTLDEAQSLGELLDALVDCASQEAARAAVLIVKGARLHGWRLVGFGPGAPQPASIQLDTDAAGVAGAVLQTGVSASWQANTAASPHGADGALPTFARGANSSFALALPILVGGSVVAVLYADVAGGSVAPASSRSSAALEILARHASRALEAMTMRQVVGVSSPTSHAPRSSRLAG